MSVHCRYEDPVGHTAHTVDFEEWEQNGNSSQAISKADVSDAQETDSASCSDKVENLLVEDFAEALDIGSAAFQDRIVSNTCSDNTPPPDADSFLSEASEQEDIGDGPYNHVSITNYQASLNSDSTARLCGQIMSVKGKLVRCSWLRKFGHLLKGLSRNSLILQSGLCLPNA